VVVDGFDLDWLGLHRQGPGHWQFTVTPGLSRFDGKFYGGTGIAVATAVMEAETGRRAVWATAQFASTTEVGATFDCHAEVVAEGRRTSQVRVTGSVADRLVFSAIGATGVSRQSDLFAQFGEMPAVPHPDDSSAWRPAVAVERTREEMGWLSICEIREAGDAGRMWMRMTGRPLSRAAISFLADVVPSGVVRAAGRTGAGTSLDNSLRFGPEPEGDWVLVDVDPLLISDGYVHGAARLWSLEGTLLGVASQTASLLLFD
jgi:acyl-CoA thioesterase